MLLLNELIDTQYNYLHFALRLPSATNKTPEGTFIGSDKLVLA